MQSDRMVETRRLYLWLATMQSSALRRKEVPRLGRQEVGCRDGGGQPLRAARMTAAALLEDKIERKGEKI